MPLDLLVLEELRERRKRPRPVCRLLTRMEPYTPPAVPQAPLTRTVGNRLLLCALPLQLMVLCRGVTLYRHKLGRMVPSAGLSAKLIVTAKKELLVEIVADVKMRYPHYGGLQYHLRFGNGGDTIGTIKHRDLCAWLNTAP